MELVAAVFGEVGHPQLGFIYPENNTLEGFLFFL